MKYIVVIALASVVLVSSAADIVAGKEKAGVCSSCHGAEGLGNEPMFPALAGKKTEYLSEQLHAFKDGTRQNQTMNAMVVPLSSEDIDNLAEFYSQLSATGE